MIDKQIKDFNENLIGLRDFVDLIDPFLNQKVKEHDKHIRPLIFSAITKDILENGKDVDEETRAKLLINQADFQKEIEENYTIVPEIIIEKADKEKGKPLAIKFDATNNDFEKHLENVTKNINHIDLLYTNSLISCLSSVEWFFSQLLHFYYDKYPASAGVQKRTMTLTDLKAFDTIADAEKHLIDVKIEEVLRGSFDSWISLLKTELSLGLGYLKDEIEGLVEIYQRRNLFVHNGGVVNSIYLSKVNESYRKDIIVGQKLKVDKEYLDKSICKLQKAFILIGAELWKKLDASDTLRGDVLADIVYENLLNNRWDICEGLSYFILNDANCNPVDKVIAQLNYWLCQKEIGNYEKIKKDIENADYSDKKEIFQLGLSALRNDEDKFFEILPLALDTKQINIERLEEFPILREIRASDAYKRFKEESKYFQEENKEIEKLDKLEK